MSKNVQEQKVKLVNHLASQVDQAHAFVVEAKKSEQSLELKELHAIAARLKTYTLKNKNSNLYKIFNKMEEYLFQITKQSTSPSHQDLDFLEKIIQMAKDQLGVIYKSLTVEVNVNTLISHSDLDQDFNELISDLSSNNGHLKIVQGDQSLSLFKKDQCKLLAKWYEEVMPVEHLKESSYKKDIFVQSLADVIDIKNAEENKENIKLQKSIETLCSKFEKLQTYSFDPIIEHIIKKAEVLSQELDKPVNVQANVQDIHIPENIAGSVINLLNDLLELIVINSLESKELRVLHGKPIISNINIEVHNNEFSLIIKVTDDGQGKELLGQLASIKNIKAQYLKDIIEQEDINYSEVNYIGRQSQYEFEIPLNPWFLKAYLITSEDKKYFIPQAQVKSFIPLTNDSIVDSKYLYGDEKISFFNTKGKVPENLDNKVGVLHLNGEGLKQILVCEKVSDPIYIKLKTKSNKSDHYIGTSQWHNGKQVSVFDIKKLCLKNANILGIV